MSKSLSEQVPHEDRLYVVRCKDGDYLEAISSTGWETVQVSFTWARDLKRARRFSDQELNFKRDTTTIMQHVQHGFAGAEQIRVR